MGMLFALILVTSYGVETVPFSYKSLHECTLAGKTAITNYSGGRRVTYICVPNRKGLK